MVTARRTERPGAPAAVGTLWMRRQLWARAVCPSSPSFSPIFHTMPSPYSPPLWPDALTPADLRTSARGSLAAPWFQKQLVACAQLRQWEELDGSSMPPFPSLLLLLPLLSLPLHCLLIFC